jgi:hypothetical protein
MEKEQIKVLIDSEEKFNEARSLLLEFGQKIETFPPFIYDSDDSSLYFSKQFKEWCLCPDQALNEIEITLEQLRELLSVESTQKMSD